MNKIVIGFRTPGVVLASALLLSSMNWAGNTSCATTKELSAFGATASNNGCYEVDQTFTNLNVTSTLGSSITQSMNTVDITGLSTWSSDATPWTNTETFSGNAGTNTAAPWTTTGHSTSIEGTVTYLTNTTEAEFAPAGYPMPPSGSGSLLIDNVSLGAAGLTGSGWGDSINITESFCVGSSVCTTGIAGDMITLTASFSGANDSTPSYTCSALKDSFAMCGSALPSTSPITVTFNGPVPTLNFSATYDLVEGYSGSADTLTDFYNTFGNEHELPEPSTFILIGTALLGLGLLRRRLIR